MWREVDVSKGKDTGFLKIVYFDEVSAQDYLDITNGGRLDWNEEKNKKRVVEILAEIEAQTQGGFNILSFLKASITGSVKTAGTGELAHIFDSTLQNTILTDYIRALKGDPNIAKFGPSGLYAPDNSISLYKMYSSYLTVVPKDQMPIDIEKLNEAVLGERGYYGMLLRQERKPKTVLRFNIMAFKNNYNLADLNKMELAFYGIKVGKCTLQELSIDKEFDFQKKTSFVSAEAIVDGVENSEEYLDVYDVVLAGVPR